MKTEENVVVFTSSGCPYCQQVLEALEEWEVSFEERNVSQDKRYFQQLRDHKLHGTPATLKGGSVVLGFQKEKLQRLLEVADHQ
ncbi:glutaredoxin family protein [Texcoconibacillus texcoconensis]|uniref:Glutaredoxin n=1 Tax=Texcoconibacillus texcoconensis TaxID=1095777 RepID=A0A840QLM6_9BACI|nr:glutaredoxin domain-containing protein [Texcoconibacillus texcoconensis]MBB5172256.1 glutaredoxin [Texcoconibacillus texcoconensis]